MSVIEWGAREQRGLAAASKKLISCVENRRLLALEQACLANIVNLGSCACDMRVNPLVPSGAQLLTMISLERHISLYWFISNGISTYAFAHHKPHTTGSMLTPRLLRVRAPNCRQNSRTATPTP